MAEATSSSNNRQSAWRQRNHSCEARFLGNSNMVITGASAICSLGREREAIVEAMRRGTDGFSSRPAPVWTGGETMTAAWVRDFKAAPTIPPMKARRMDRSSQMAIVAAHAALREADWAVEREGSEALGIFLGSGFCGTHSSALIVQTVFEQGPEEASAAAFANTVPNAPAGQLAIFFGLEGPSATLLQSGTTADSALLCAQEHLRQNQCRAALWAGVDELSEYLWFGWRHLGWVGESSAKRRYGWPLHPLSRGFAGGEAAAALVVEPDSAAQARRARPRAVIEYVATGAVAAEPWAYPPMDQIEEAVRFFQKAVTHGGEPDLVLGCANGHPRLDRFEAEVLRQLVGGKAAVWFAKGQVGETMASAALRAVLAVWLIEENFVPGNFWLKQKEGEAAAGPGLGLVLPSEAIPRAVERVLVPTISAGGTLGAVMIARIR